MKSKVLKDKTKKMLKTGNLPYTHRPYIGFDSYVLTYEESLNVAMIDRSDLVLFCVEKRENSGAYKAYRYAAKKRKNIINLYM